MPELPEVETTCRGIADHVIGQKISRININNPSLRWPVPVQEIQSALPGSTINAVGRRAKYILLDCGNGHLIIHLGMSGSLRIVDQTTQTEKHDHVEIFFANGTVLRLRDPRRFGAVLWTDKLPENHALIVSLGPEPLKDEFNAEYLFQQTRKRKRSIKNLIMDAHIVVGVGNIYASEALFHAGLRPGKSAGRLTKTNCLRLVMEIRRVLNLAIAAGGTTLRDFTDSDGKAGYFSQELFVYGRAGDSCLACCGTIKRMMIGQRSSFYCPNCQK